MQYPSELLFDLETLVNSAQPGSILLLGHFDENGDVLALQKRLQDYAAQLDLLNQSCLITTIASTDLDTLMEIDRRYDLGIVINLFEHISKPQGQRVLSRLRDILTEQYCIALPITSQNTESNWSIPELFGFALRRVGIYQQQETEYGLFKYQLRSYKNTPDWLNADNWANPQMWGKYWW